MAEFIVVHSVKVATDFVPETFGRLTTIGPVFWLPSKRRWRVQYQVCQCSCGDMIIANRYHIKTGTTGSCGCLHKERASQANITHGLRHLPEYHVWKGVKRRCVNHNDPDYPNYGGRGIRVCDRWLEPNGQGFLNFLSDMGPRPANHTIERKQVNGNYCSENCCWATPTEQSRNKRNNINITFNGKTQCIAAWAEEIGYTSSLINSRLSRGWPVEKALSQPPRKLKRK